MQRLFSTFAGGWPGAGLLLLRLLTAVALIGFGISGIREEPPLSIVALQIISIAGAIPLLLGVFTPLAGILAAGAELWIAIFRFSAHSADPWVTLGQAILAAALAMIGPGALSIDARRFGRKHIDLSRH